MVLIDVGPPGLRVADEDHLGIFLEHFVEALESGVVTVVLEVGEDGDVEVGGHFGDALERGGVAVDLEFLFANADGAAAQVFFDFDIRPFDERDFVGEEAVFARQTARELDDSLVAARVDFEAEIFARGEQDGVGDAELALMGDELLVGASGVVGVLVDVDDRFAGDRRSGIGLGGAATECGAEGGGSGYVEEVAAVHGSE